MIFLVVYICPLQYLGHNILKTFVAYLIFTSSWWCLAALGVGAASGGALLFMSDFSLLC